MTVTLFRPALLAALAVVLAGCSPEKSDTSVATAAAAPRADSVSAPSDRLGPGVTVDTQKIEDSTVAEMYMPEDSAGGR